MTTSTTVMSSADRSKFECLFMRLERLLFSIAYGILQNVTLAEDAVSETALRAVKYFDRFKDADDVKARAYLCAICKSVSYNMLKSVNRTTPNSDIVTLNPDQNDFSNPESTYVENEELALAIKTIDKLDDKYKIVLLLKYACHLDRKAIADLCGISLENVKKRISRAKTMVCETLKKEDVLK